MTIIRTLTVILIACAFLFPPPAGADGSASAAETSTLAPELRLKPFSSKHGLEFKSLMQAAYAVKDIKERVDANTLRDSDIARLNKKFPGGAVAIDPVIRHAAFACSGRQYAYAVVNFRTEQKKVRALLVDSLTADERAELRISDEEKDLLAYPGLEGIWFVVEKRRPEDTSPGGMMGRWEYRAAALAPDGTLTLRGATRIPRKDGVVESEFLRRGKNTRRDIVLKTRPMTAREKRRSAAARRKLGLTVEPRVIERDASAIAHRIYGIAAEGIPFIREDIIDRGNIRQITEALDHENRELAGASHETIRKKQFKGDLRALISELSARDIFEKELSRRPEGTARAALPVGADIAGKDPRTLTAKEAADIFPIALLRRTPLARGDGLRVKITPPEKNLRNSDPNALNTAYLVPMGAVQQTEFSLRNGDTELASVKLSHHDGTLYFMLLLAPELRGLGIGELWVEDILVPYAKSLRATTLATLYTCGDSAYDHFIRKMGFTKESRGIDDHDDFQEIIFYHSSIPLSRYADTKARRKDIDLDTLEQRIEEKRIRLEWANPVQNFRGSVEYLLQLMKEAEEDRFGRGEKITVDDVARGAAGKDCEHVVFGHDTKDRAIARAVIERAGVSRSMPLADKLRAYLAVAKVMEGDVQKGINPLAKKADAPAAEAKRTDPAEALRLGVADAENIHQTNLEPAFMPTLPPRTMLCHIVTDAIVPTEQRASLKTGLEQAMSKKDVYAERVACLSGVDTTDAAAYIAELRRLVQEKRDEYHKLGYADVRFTLACPDKKLVANVLESGIGIDKALAFAPHDDDLDVVQIEGIMLALRALYGGDIQRLRTAFSFLAGRPLTAAERKAGDIRTFMRTITFQLPAAHIEDYAKRRELRDLIVHNILMAA